MFERTGLMRVGRFDCTSYFWSRSPRQQVFRHGQEIRKGLSSLFHRSIELSLMLAPASSTAGSSIWFGVRTNRYHDGLA